MNGEITMRRLALAHAGLNLFGGIWPLVSMRTFEAVFGPKVDRWLVCTVAGLLTTVGVTQLRSRSDEQLELVRVVSMGTSLTLLAVDRANAPRGRISRMYLVDAAFQLAFLAAWAGTLRQD
ncbi:MAG: hypothetical protein HY829_09585 [Actinobacteria bacterium]|nr:hypothetical protein [Actinomycetota bacterium]